MYIVSSARRGVAGVRPSRRATPIAWVHGLVLLAVILLGAFVPAPPASATVVLNGASAGEWPAEWSHYTYANGDRIGDVNGDESPANSDLASGACSGCAGPASSVALTSDGTNAFFRMRMGAYDNNDVNKGGLFGGAFLVQIADANNQVRAVVGVDGTSTNADYVYVTNAVGANLTKVYEYPFTSGTPSSAAMRWITTGDGTGQFFLDFQVPVSAIQTVSGGTVTATTPIKLYYGTSAASNLATINKDFMLGAVTAVDFTNLAVVKLVTPTYNVSFDSNGGTPATIDAQSVKEGSTATTPTAPTRDGYTFDGWYTEPTGGSLWNFGTGVTSTTTLYAHWTKITYTVTFDANGGSAVPSQVVDPGGVASRPTSDPVRAGHTFVDWYTGSGQDATPFDFETPITGATTIQARWSANNYPVTFEPGNGDVPNTQVVGYGGTVDEPAQAPTREGYTFAGWYDGAGANADPWDFDSDRVTGETTIYAHWTLNSYTVAFDSSGGSAVPDQNVDHGDPATAPTEDPTREGHTFAGWYDGTGENATPYNFETPITGATTIHARWTINSYAVTFDSNDGSAVDGQTIDHGAMATAPAGDPTRDGYTFVGWYTQAEGGSLWDFSTGVTSELTLYAHWSINTHAVTFDPNDGSATQTVKVNHGDTVTAPAEDPTREGYTFTGWYTGTGENATAYDFGTAVTTATTMYAHWTLNSYAVSFDSNGGTTVPSQNVDHSDTATEPADPTREGYTFTGWYTGTGPEAGAWDFETDTVTEATTLVAHWDLNSYTVSFDSNGGSTVPDQNVDHGDTATEPGDPTREGYTFTGWYTGTGENPTAYDFATPVNGGLTVTAHWTINSYTVSFDSNGGGIVPDQNVDHGGTATEPADPTREGYTFTGWYTGTGENATAYDFASPVIGNLVVTAHWSRNNYTVSFDTHGGTTVPDQTVPHGDQAITPTLPTRNGQIFTGWYTQATGGTSYDFTTPVTGALTLHAQWAPADTDGDGLKDEQEAELGTDPADPDTDGDGIEDGAEVEGSLNTHAHCPTDPLESDTDHDTLDDGREIRGVALKGKIVLRQRSITGKLVKPDPCRADTDRDGLSDSVEVRGFHTSKLDKVYRSHPLRKDTDRDGLSDRAEVTGSANRAFGRKPTDPMHWDTDRGGVSDGGEVRKGSDPTSLRSWPAHPGLTF